MTRGLVLGGGGPVGIAWEIGVAAGLASAGLDIGQADRILGTSAGSVVGAQLASGRSPGDLLAQHRAYTSDPGDPAGAAPDLSRLLAFFMRRPQAGYPDAALLAEMGAYALGSRTVSEPLFLARVASLLPEPGTVWPAHFACTAVEVTTGSYRIWDREAGVDLLAAVASSCAVPGVFPPVTIGDARYMDGCMRSSTNSDGATGCERVLVLAVTVNPIAGLMAGIAARELAALESGGARTALIVPDAAALAAFGPNLMDASRHLTVSQAGFDQGVREAGRIAPLWG